MAKQGAAIVVVAGGAIVVVFAGGDNTIADVFAVVVAFELNSPAWLELIAPYATTPIIARITILAVSLIRPPMPLFSFIWYFTIF